MNQTDTTITQMSLLNEAPSSTLIVSIAKVPMCSLSTQVPSVFLDAQVAQVRKCLKCPASPNKLPQALNCLKRLPQLQRFLLQ